MMTVSYGGGKVIARSEARATKQSVNKSSHLIKNPYFIVMKPGFIYILTNKNNTTLYIGVTSDLPGRILQHRTKKYPKSFTARYGLDKLVYWESFISIIQAIAREKQLKAGSRKKKTDLIHLSNPEWLDLYEELEIH